MRSLRAHGRYPYSAITRRRDYSWPDGRRLALYIGFNLEHFEFKRQVEAVVRSRSEEALRRPAKPETTR